MTEERRTSGMCTTCSRKRTDSCTQYPPLIPPGVHVYTLHCSDYERYIPPRHDEKTQCLSCIYLHDDFFDDGYKFCEMMEESHPTDFYKTCVSCTAYIERR